MLPVGFASPLTAPRVLRLLRLLVGSALVAPWTVLLILDASGLFLLVFGCAIVAAFARRTFEGDNVAHDSLLRL
jgi:hypothetical protein